MKKFFVALAIFAAVETIPSALQDLLSAQTPVTATTSAQSSIRDVAARSRDLSRLFSDIWQDKVRHNPEYASVLQRPGWSSGRMLWRSRESAR